MRPRKVAIIGCGIAGLAAAIRLAVAGHAVAVFEKNESPGGKLGVLEKDGYHFDTGPSLFVQPENIFDLFNLAGEQVAGEFSCIPIDIACRYFFENGRLVNGFASAEKFSTELQAVLDEDPKAVTIYLANAQMLYDHLAAVFINHSLQSANTWLNKATLGALSVVKPAYLFSTLASWNNRCFKKEETRQIFNRFATYSGSNPYAAPAMLSLIPHLEHNLGVFAVRGGMFSIVRALHSLAIKKGVVFNFNSPVHEIIQEGKSIRGIRSGEASHSAEIVVANADVHWVYRHLLNDERRAKELDKKEGSSSAIVFYWGMNRAYESLDLHNVFFSRDYKKEFEQIFQQHQIPDDPTVYINISSKTDPGHAPRHCENWFVMVNAPVNNQQNWEKEMGRLREGVIQKLERILREPVRQHIVSESIMDPQDLEKRHFAFRGSIYGASSNSVLSAFKRHANFSSQFAGLYFCGGTVHPGGGIPLCLKGAKIVADLVEKDIQRKRI